MHVEDAQLLKISLSLSLSLSPADIFDSVFQRFERFVQPGVKARFEGTDRETSDRLTQGQFFSFEFFLLLADFCKQAPLPSARHFLDIHIEFVFEVDWSVAALFRTTSLW